MELGAADAAYECLGLVGIYLHVTAARSNVEEAEGQERSIRE